MSWRSAGLSIGNLFSPLGGKLPHKHKVANRRASVTAEEILTDAVWRASRSDDEFGYPYTYSNEKGETLFLLPYEDEKRKLRMQVAWKHRVEGETWADQFFSGQRMLGVGKGDCMGLWKYDHDDKTSGLPVFTRCFGAGFEHEVGLRRPLANPWSPNACLVKDEDANDMIFVAPPLQMHCQVRWNDVRSVDVMEQHFTADVFVEVRIRGVAAHNPFQAEIPDECVTKFLAAYELTFEKDAKHKPKPFVQLINYLDRTEHIETWAVKEGRPEYGQTDFCFRHRAIGRFAEEFELQQFPFDTQELTVRVELNRTDDVAVLCTNVDVPSYAVWRRFCLGAMYTPILGDAVATRVNMSDPTETTNMKVYSQFVSRVFLRRLGGFYIVNIIAPLLMATALCGVVWFPISLDPETGETSIVSVENRLFHTTTLLLTAVAYRLVVNTVVPGVSYLTLIHEYMHTCFFFILFALAEQAAHDPFWDWVQHNHQLALKPYYITAIVFYGLLLLSVIYFWLYVKHRHRVEDAWAADAIDASESMRQTALQLRHDYENELDQQKDESGAIVTRARKECWANTYAKYNRKKKFAHLLLIWSREWKQAMSPSAPTAEDRDVLAATPFDDLIRFVTGRQKERVQAVAHPTLTDQVNTKLEAKAAAYREDRLRYLAHVGEELSHLLQDPAVSLSLRPSPTFLAGKAAPGLKQLLIGSGPARPPAAAAGAGDADNGTHCLLWRNRPKAKGRCRRSLPPSSRSIAPAAPPAGRGTNPPNNDLKRRSHPPHSAGARPRRHRRRSSSSSSSSSSSGSSSSSDDESCLCWKCVTGDLMEVLGRLQAGCGAELDLGKRRATVIQALDQALQGRRDRRTALRNLLLALESEEAPTGLDSKELGKLLKKWLRAREQTTEGAGGLTQEEL